MRARVQVVQIQRMLKYLHDFSLLGRLISNTQNKYANSMCTIALIPNYESSSISFSIAYVDVATKGQFPIPQGQIEVELREALTGFIRL